MRILFIAPFPPPVTGQSLAVEVIYNELIKNNEIEIVNLSKDSFNAGISSIKRVWQIFKIFAEVRRKKKVDLIYFTVSESFSGNLKDLIIYLICFKRLNKTIIHMLGGAGMKKILSQKKSILYKLNKFFVGRVGWIVVEGKNQAMMFSKIFSKEKISVIPNFAEDFLFVDDHQINENFKITQPLRILFLSNLIYGKGHYELVEAYTKLSETLKEKVIINFVGGFASQQEKELFLETIKNYKGLNYLGLIVGKEKSSIYSAAHVFCLPTYYPYEGQPFCIVEAYAAGCVVVTTNHSGIFNVFEPGVNGFEVIKKSSDSIQMVIEDMIRNYQKLLPIAMSNNLLANKKYRSSNYLKSFSETIDAWENY